MDKEKLKERKRIIARRWYENNKEKKLEYMRNYYKNNFEFREKIKARIKDWRNEHREEYNKKMRIYMRERLEIKPENYKQRIKKIKPLIKEEKNELENNGDKNDK